MERGFLIRWKIMRLSESDQKRHCRRKVIVWLKDIYQNYGTLPVLVYSMLIMGIHLTCSI
ncbi:hypothetical protein Goshw_029332 [Gossypium schwendimanii]|uniref:Uncharacterized protein n=1 Tax=Gossypium schwendimanii TaxID=34291 RepID=A0A7J9N9T8_GOSSC|nr:hypothetical protein [Gossypium schwendimanii]